MPRYHTGDVVIVRFPYTDDPKQDKVRPAVVISEPQSPDGEQYLVCKITRPKPDPLYYPGFHAVKMASIEGKEMGLLQDSFVVYDTVALLEPFLILKKIGICRFSKEILSYHFEKIKKENRSQ
jgi:hypothetical protein